MIFDRIACGTVTRRALKEIVLDELIFQSSIALLRTQITHRVLLGKTKLILKKKEEEKETICVSFY